MITLNPKSVLFILYAAVRGIKTHSEELEDVQIGQTRETKREVTEIVADVTEASNAKKLRNKVRAAGAKYCTTVRGFTVSDSDRVALFQSELEPIRAEIALHNATAKFHPVEVEFTAVPLAMSVTPETARSIYKEIAARLDAAKEHVQRGDTASLEAWLRRNRALGAFLPAAAAAVLNDAFEELKNAREAIKDALKQKPPVAPEVKGAEIVSLGLFNVDTARGLVSVTPDLASSAPVASLAGVA